MQRYKFKRFTVPFNFLFMGGEESDCVTNSEMKTEINRILIFLILAYWVFQTARAESLPGKRDKLNAYFHIK